MTGVYDDSHPMDVLWAQIRSLERRAQSIESEAMQLAEGADVDSRFRLGLESRSLRTQAQALRKQRSEAMFDAISSQFDPQIR